MRIEWNERRDPQGNVLWPYDELHPLGFHNDNLGPTFAERFRAMIEGFALFNPHATIHLDWFGERTTWQATDREWEKWKPFSPTSPHWYEVRHLERLIGAYIAHGRDNESDRLVSDFLAEFDGLTGSHKRAKVLNETGLKRVRLSELVRGDRLDGDRIAGMLASMQQHTRPVKAKRLGLIGEDHLRTRLLAMGVQPGSFRYARKLSDGKCKKTQIAAAGESKLYSTVPWVLESAFGWKGGAPENNRSIFAGANWSAAIKNPFRSFGATGEGLEAALSELRAGAHEPIVYVLHLAHPRVEYSDRGKSTIVIGGAA